MDELIEKAKNGSSKSFMAIIEGVRVQMYKTAIVQLHNEQDALDAIQETLIKAFTNIKRLKQNQFFKSWLIRILLNECHNIQRYRSKVIPMEKEILDLNNSHFENGFEPVEMDSYLSQLDDIYRVVVDLRYNHDLKLEEISKVLDIPIGTVKSRLNRAHAILKQHYTQKEVSS